MNNVELARTIVQTVRANANDAGAEIAVYALLTAIESAVIERSALIAGFHAEQERLKGAGTMLRRNKGEANDADVKLFQWRYNLARDIERDIRAGKVGTAADAAQQDNDAVMPRMPPVPIIGEAD